MQNIIYWKQRPKRIELEEHLLAVVEYGYNVRLILIVLALSDQEPEGDLAPKFLTRFYDQQTTEGTATDFKCLIAGRPEPSVTWLLDDLEIREGQGVRMRHKDGMVSLEIKSPKVDQSGTYTCQLKYVLVSPVFLFTCLFKLSAEQFLSITS